METIKVTNRNNGSTGYSISDQNIYRNFAPQETKNISIEELKSLSYVPGGEYILKNFLIVNDRPALEELNLVVEPEYFYTEAEIKKILLEGSLDQLEDTLNFAPEGVIELIKKMAVEMEIPDVRKRDMISEKTGFSISSAINVNKIMDAEISSKEQEDDKPVRKVQSAIRKVQVKTEE